MLAQCERFGCLPSQLFDEDGGLLQLLEIEALVRGGTEEVHGDGG